MLLLKRFWRFALHVWMYAGLIVGPIMLLVALGLLVYTVHFLRTAQRTVGRVLEMKQNTDSDGNVSFAPVFQFVAANATQHTVESHMSSNPPSFEVGQTVAIRYDPNDPGFARVASYWQTWGYESVFAILSVVFTALGLGIRRWFRKKPRFAEVSRV